MRALVSILFFLGLLAIFFIAKSVRPGAETLIYNVPYPASMYNSYSKPFSSGVAFAAYTILAYWRQFDEAIPAPSLESLNKRFPITELTHSLEVEQYFQELGFETKIIRSRDINQLARFFKKERSPLIFKQLPSVEARGRFMPYRVLLGVSAPQKTLTAHDFYLGPALTISAKEWHASQPEEVAENFKHLFLLARPKNYKTLLDQKFLEGRPYPDRQEYDKLTSAVARYVDSIELEITAEERCLRIATAKNDPAYPRLHPAVRSRILANNAECLNELGRYEESKQSAAEAISLAEEGFFDDSWDTIWRIDESLYPAASSIKPIVMSFSYAGLGDAHFGLGEKSEALKSYQKSIELQPQAEWAGRITDSIKLLTIEEDQ